MRVPTRDQTQYFLRLPSDTDTCRHSPAQVDKVARCSEGREINSLSFTTPDGTGSCWHFTSMNERDRYMLLSEVASEARVSLSSVRHWLRTGKLQSVRPGRRRLIRRTDFEQFIASDFGDAEKKGAP